MNLDQIGLQLYTVRTAATTDFLGTLRAVAEMGYPAVEFAGLHGHPAAEVRAEMNSTGLKAPSAHVQYASLLTDTEAVCADLRTLGCQYAIVPYIGEEHRNSVQSARKFVASLAPIAEAVAECGMTLGYHNHDFEFAPLPGGDGTTLWDLIVAETDPALVVLELDCYWSTYGGADTLALLRGESSADSPFSTSRTCSARERIAMTRRSGQATWISARFSRRPTGHNRVVHRRAGQPGRSRWSTPKPASAACKPLPNNHARTRHSPCG